MIKKGIIIFSTIAIMSASKAYAAEMPNVAAAQLDVLEAKLSEAISKHDFSKKDSVVKQITIESIIAIINMENSLRVIEEEIKIESEKQELNEIRHKYDLMTEEDYYEQKASYDSLLAQKKECENAVGKAFEVLYDLLGQDALIYYDSMKNHEYEQLSDFDLPAHIMKISDEYVSTSVLSDDMLDDKLFEIEYYLTGVYNDLKLMEKDIDENEKELITMKRIQEINALQVKLGKISQLEHDEYGLSMMEKQNVIDSLKLFHYLALENLQSPSFSNI